MGEMLGITFNWPWETKPVDGDSEFSLAAKHLTAQFAMNGVEMVIDTAVHNVAFFGILVTSEAVVGNAALDPNLVAGVTDATIVGTTLGVGYHPLAGTSFRITSGVVYLLRRAKTNIDV